MGVFPRHVCFSSKRIQFELQGERLRRPETLHVWILDQNNKAVIQKIFTEIMRLRA